MAGNDERVNLLVSAAVEGLNNVESLIGELQDLEQAGGKEIPDNTEGLRSGVTETSQAMEGLAGRLQRLQKQQGLVTQFAELKRETQQLAKEQQEASNTATDLGRAYAKLENPTRAQTREFENARKASRETDQAYINNQQSLNRLRGELEGAGVSTRDLAGEQVRIRQELGEVNAEAEDLSGELRQMRDSARGAAQGTEEAAAGTERLADVVEGARGKLGKLGGILKTVGASIVGLTAAAGASIATLTVFSRRQASIADELTNTSNAIGVNREQLQLWRIAGDRVGLSGEKVSDILRSVSERLGEFSRTGGGEAAQVLDTLNLKIRDFRDLSPDEQMRLLAQAIGEIGSQSEQVALLEKLASDASQLQPLLEDNAAGLEEIFRQAQQQGAIYSDEELNKLNRANDIYNDIDLKLKALVSRISVELAPVVAETTEKVLELFGTSKDGEDLVDVFKRLVRQSGDFVKNLVENGDDIADRFRTITTVLQVMGNTGRTVFNGMMTAVSTFGTLLSTSISLMLSLVQGVAKGLEAIGAISDESYGKVEALAEKARAKTKELAQQTADYASATVDAGGDIVGVFTDIEEAANQVKQEVADLKPVPPEFTDEAKDAELSFEQLKEQIRDAQGDFEKVGIDGYQALTGISTEARKAIDSIAQMASTIKDAGLEGEAAATAFEQGFGEAISKINSEEGLTELKAKIQGLKEDGEIGAVGANTALEKIRKKMMELSLEELDLGLDKVGDDADEAADKVDNLKDKAKEAADEAEAGKEKWRAALGNWFGEILSNARESVTQLSDAARNFFEERIGSNQFVKEAESTAEAMGRIYQRLQEIRVSMTKNPVGAFLTTWALETEKASLEVQQAFYAQADAVENLQRKVESGAMSMSELNRLSTTAARRFALLDDQRLANLQSAIDSARSKMESLNSSAESTLNSLRQRLADIQGDTEEAQRLQYEAERRRLEEELKRARESGADAAAADYQEALKQLEKINQIEQRNRQEQENERERAAADRQREQEQAERERQQAQREINRPATTPQPSTESVKTVNINLGGESFRVLADDESAFLNALENARSTAL